MTGAGRHANAIAAKLHSTIRKTRTAGRRPRSTWARRVAFGLRHLTDPFTLRTPELVRLAAVDRLRAERYPRMAFGRALALRDLLTQAVEHACVALPHPLDRFLQRYAQGVPIAVIARDLGLTRQYISRAYRPKCIEAVTSEFLALVDRRVSDNVNARTEPTRPPGRARLVGPTARRRGASRVGHTPRPASRRSSGL